MRMGLLTPDAQALFASRCSGPLQTPHGIEPTVLGTHLAAVDRVNTRKLDELPTRMHRWFACGTTKTS